MGRGKLVFKGDDERTKKKKKKSKHRKKETTTAPSVSSASATAAAASASTTQEDPSRRNIIETPTVKQGTGTITVSGTVVTGFETRFTRELAVGDAILLKGNGGGEEMRVVTMCISDTSLNLSSSFSMSNTSTPMSFQYIRKPKTQQLVAAEARRLAQKEEEQHKQEQEHAFGTYASNTNTTTATSTGTGCVGELVYREKTEHGSYRIKRVKVDLQDHQQQDLTRTSLLEMRTKKKSDKYC